MNQLKLLVLLGLLLVCNVLFAAIHYVGQSARCNGSNDHNSLAVALFAAALNGAENDEIRLTNTVTYLGNGDGTTTLSGWNSASAGALVIAGGYANCGDPVNDVNAVIGDGTTPVFEIQGESEVTLRRMQTYGSDSRGIIIRDGSTVFFESVDVSFNAAGVRVLEGSYLSVDASSIIQNNGDLENIPRGGGLWCFGANSEIDIAGQVSFNQATRGGNIFVENGCLVRMSGGARVKGNAELSQYNANQGGGIYVDNGGTLFANGGSSRVIIENNWAENGGGLYVNGSGQATILNTFFNNNMADLRGAGFYANDGGNSVTQVIMDRAPQCPFVISCSEFQNNKYRFSVVEVDNSRVRIQRTIFEGNSANEFTTIPSELVGNSNGRLEMSRVNFINNETSYLSVFLGQNEVSHVTATGNYFQLQGEPRANSYAFLSNSLGSIKVENSIFQDTQGVLDTGNANITGKCNLVDDGTDWPPGIFFVRTAQFNNSAGGDARQLASSPGVDMCLQDTFAWSTEIDIEYQGAPVNERTNAQGLPGETGGLFDAGFDEVYNNIGEDEFLLTVQKEGSGEGLLLSDPLGIACGSDCSEVVFNGTLVKLIATPFTGSEFIRWLNCPLPDGNDCYISVVNSTTITALFQPDDLIFSDDFE